MKGSLSKSRGGGRWREEDGENGKDSEGEVGRGRVKEEQGENNVKESNRKERVYVKESGVRGREEDRGVRGVRKCGGV